MGRAPGRNPHTGATAFLEMGRPGRRRNEARAAAALFRRENRTTRSRQRAGRTALETDSSATLAPCAGTDGTTDGTDEETKGRLPMKISRIAFVLLATAMALPAFGQETSIGGRLLIRGKDGKDLALNTATELDLGPSG